MPADPDDRWRLRTPTIAGRALYGNVPVAVFIALSLGGLFLFSVLREPMGGVAAAVFAILLSMAGHEAVRAVTMRDPDWVDVARERAFLRGALAAITLWRRWMFRWPE